MSTYSYRCKDCEAEFDKASRADAIKCETDDCKGWARRVWSTVNFNRVPGGGRAHK